MRQPATEEVRDMPKLGHMKEVSDNATGEVFFAGALMAVPEVKSFTSIPNPRCTGEPNSPDYIIRVGAREMGRIFPSKPDVNGNGVRGVILDGYPLKWAVRLTAFQDPESGEWALDYRAASEAKAEAAA